MKMRSNCWLLYPLLVAAVFSFAVDAQQSSVPANVPAQPTAPAKHVPRSVDEGQRVFELHCSRCHTAPEGFSPRISGTIVRHMRVRASLSRYEERALLRFFNP